MIPEQLARRADRRRHRLHALLEVAGDVLDHDDRVVDHQPIASTSASRVSRFIEIPEIDIIRRCRSATAGIATVADQHRPERPEEQEHDAGDDQQRLDQRAHDLVDRAVHDAVES